MPSLRCTADINGTRETIFDLIADLAHYDRWLPGSRVFGGMTQVSPVSPGISTTYADGMTGAQASDARRGRCPGGTISGSQGSKR